jgi:hypothetical protein
LPDSIAESKKEEITNTEPFFVRILELWVNDPQRGPRWAAEGIVAVQRHWRTSKALASIKFKRSSSRASNCAAAPENTVRCLDIVPTKERSIA